MIKQRGKLFTIKSLILFILMLSIPLNANQLKEIQQKGEIVVGVKQDYDPFGFISRTGKTIGFEIDLASYIAQKLGVKLKLVPVTPRDRISMLLSKKVDIIIATMTHNRFIDQEIDFSITYFYDGKAMLVQKDSPVNSYQDFQNKTMGAVKGESSGEVFEVIQPLATIKYYENYKQLFDALDKKEIEGITSDYAFLLAKVKKNRFKYKIVGKAFTIEPYGVALRENQSDLRDEINFIIQASVKSGYYDEIYKKWFNKLAYKKPILWP